MVLGKVSRSESKSSDEDNPVEAKRQSKIAGTAIGGTLRKLSDSELKTEAIEKILL